MQVKAVLISYITSPLLAEAGVPRNKNEEHFTGLRERENRRTEERRGRTECVGGVVGEGGGMGGGGASKADSSHCFHMLQHPSGNS